MVAGSYEIGESAVERGEDERRERYEGGGAVE